MRHRAITILAALFCLTLAYAGNLSVEPISLKPGETKELKFSLSSSAIDMSGVQFDMTLPEGFVLKSYSDDNLYMLSSNQPSDLSCTVNNLDSDTYRFMLYSNTLQKLNEGELIRLNLQVSNTKALGSYEIPIDNVRFSDIDGNVTKENGVKSNVKVTDFFTLLYMVDDVEYKSYEIEYGATITAESAPTKEGYTFSGWSEIPATMPAKDVVITGTFTVNSYTLTYMVDGKEHKNSTVPYGTTLTPEAEPTKEGYTFSGWSEIPATMPAKNVVVTGTFTVNSYTLTYIVDGKEHKTSTIPYGTTITPEAEPTKEGYTFSGWSEIPATMPAKDVMITGNFSINSYILTYMVDGKEYKTSTVPYGTTLTPETEPSKEGYTFSGWSEIPETMPAKDVTVTGTFSINKYKLIYMVDNAEYKTFEVEYGATIVSESEPTKEGYTFSGWSEIPTTMPSKDVVVTGAFSINSYTLTYLVDGKEHKTSTVPYGTTLTPEAEPTKEGYTFSGWSEIPETMPAKDVTVTGSFSINKYKLIYMVDDAEYKTIEVEYGATIVSESEPTKEGHTFSGWSSIPKTMPAKDVVVTGTFTVNSYTLTYIVDGKEHKTSTVPYGTTITPETEPTKEGYTFSGWSEIPATMPAKNVVVTGTFTVNSYTLTYMVDEKEYKTTVIPYGTTLTPEVEPTKEGYTFSGWSEIPETMPAKDVTVTGTFSINKYKLIYMVDNAEYKTFEVEYGATIVSESEPTKEGYTFSGWSEIPTTMPSKDVVVTGAFSINSYTLTYLVDGKEHKTSTVPYGTTLTPEAEPTKEGYTFSGWSEIPETMPAKDVTVTGSFSINKYKLIYMVDDAEYKTIEVEYGATIVSESEPTKEGHTFSGWSSIPKTMPAKDVVVTGTFTVNSYTLTYIVDGKEHKTSTVPYGTTITPETEPTKEGYTFSGWSEIPATMPAKNVVVTGTFTVNSYTLTYMVDEKEYKTTVIPYGTTLTPEVEPTKEGYTFSGWSEIPKTMPAKDVTVTGSFSINKYKLIYMVDNAEYKTIEVEYGATITAESEPTKEGYTFSGWSNIPETMPAHDVTVTGSFSKGAFTLTYVVDGEIYKIIKYDYEALITAESEPTREGYTFSGWSEIPETMPAHNVTITGTFSINKYKLTYMVDDAEYKTVEVEYGAAIVSESEPIKEGYTFSGWSEIPETMPAHNVTITGTFSINKYKLIYMVDDAEYKIVEVEYGATIVSESEPTKEGYTFSGWSEIPATMPAKDVVITGTFTVNSYTLTYMVDGKEHKTSTVPYGTTLTPETEPTKEGYTFSGWSEIPETMPAKNVVVTGSFSINSYTLTYLVDGKEHKTSTVPYGTTLTPETEPTKEGYTFSGWSSIPKTMPAKDVVVTGTFTVNSYTLTYMVDGKEHKTSTVPYGTTLTPEAEPTKEGYTFSGWSEIPATMPAKNVVITGTFSINKYKLIYMVDDVEYKNIEVEYGATITAESEPTKEGYTFSGWGEIPKTMPAHDVTVTGSFSKGAFTLIYVVDGETYKTIKYDYEALITAESEPTREGYTFSGWSEIPETMPAHDVTVTGTFCINKYKLIYKVDAIEYKTIEVEYGATIVSESEPTKEGYTFSGWSEIPNTMPAHDVTVTGMFCINKYKLIYMVDDAEYKTIEVEYGATIVSESEPTKEGYTFSGWSSIPKTMPAHDVTVTGAFSKGAFTLTYVVDGETYKTIKYDYEALITTESEPTKEGYTFSGWSEIPETMPAHDVVVTGSFTVNSYVVSFMNGNEVLHTEKVVFGEPIPLPDIKDEHGRVYKWLDVPETMPAHDIVIQAYQTDAISDITNEKQIKAYYLPNGQPIAKPQRGINIILMNDGTVKKIMIK